MSTILSKVAVKAAVLAGCLAASAAANAGFYYSDALGNPDGSVTNFAINGPGTGFNNFASPLATAGVGNANLGTSLAVTGPGNVTFSLWGKEAGYTNQFNYSGSQLFTTAGLTDSLWSNWNTSGPFAVNAGVLNFSYCVIAGGTGCTSNLNNQGSSLGSPQSIGIKIVDDNTAWLLWDDSGAGPDDNHDDMIVKVQYTAVPEPATTLLFGVGLVGIYLGMRKRALKAQV